MMYSGQHPPPPNYVMLQNPYGAAPPPYYQPYPQRRRSGGSCCLRCICCIYFLLFLLIFTSAAGLFIMYTFYQPKVPVYKVEDFSVTTFNFLPDLTLKADFLVTIRAENRNDKIGFIYGQDNSVTMSFEDSTLCSGKMPPFYHAHRNVTILKIPLVGQTSVWPGEQGSLMEKGQQGWIPLLIKLKVPITIVLDTFPLRQFIFLVDCRLVVDDLKPNRKPNILTTTYKFGVRL